MREYCLVTSNGTVVNMCMNYKPTGPLLNEFQMSKGYRWVPAEKVPLEKIRQYQYWSERP